MFYISFIVIYLTSPYATIVSLYRENEFYLNISINISSVGSWGFLSDLLLGFNLVREEINFLPSSAPSNVLNLGEKMDKSQTSYSYHTKNWPLQFKQIEVS